MKAFTELFYELDSTTKINDRIASLVKYFQTADEHDKLYAVALLSGKSPPRAVNSNFIRQWAAEEANLPDWLFEIAHHTVGDLAETIAILIPDTSDNSEHPSLRQYLAEIQALKKADEDTRREYIKTQWQRLTQPERLVFNKLVMGMSRIGVSKGLIIKALAQYAGLEEPIIAHRLSGSWDPAKITLDKLLHTEAPEETASRPYPFYLAYAIDIPFEELGPTTDWIIEHKWDGIRGQLIYRNGQIHIWSRNEELLTDRFPELHALHEVLPQNTVLDGEILVWRDGKVQPFAELQKRITRKNVTKAIMKEFPVILLTYDLLELNGEDLRAKPIVERRALLEDVVKKAHHESLCISEVIACTTWEEAAAEREKARGFMSEGLMLKRKSSEYRTGRRRGDWWKWKIDPLSIDAVLIYAMSGHGRRANLYTDLTFAVWDDGKLVPFTKAYSGLTDKEFNVLDAFVKKNTIERFGPVRSVKPELVFEIAFEGIAKSSRHKSGIALRFPRILRERFDKNAEDANTLDDLKKMLELYGKGNVDVS